MKKYYKAQYENRSAIRSSTSEKIIYTHAVIDTYATSSQIVFASFHSRLDLAATRVAECGLGAEVTVVEVKQITAAEYKALNAIATEEHEAFLAVKREKFFTAYPKMVEIMSHNLEFRNGFDIFTTAHLGYCIKTYGELSNRQALEVIALYEAKSYKPIMEKVGA